jgi:hypothetical protein
MYYAIEYAYGSNVVNNGARADKVEAFTTRQERDEWVNQGSAYVGSGERRAIPASSKAVKSYKENDKHLREWFRSDDDFNEAVRFSKEDAAR